MKKGTKTIALLALAALVALLAAGCGDDFYTYSGDMREDKVGGRVINFRSKPGVQLAIDFDALALGYADEKEDADYVPGSLSWGWVGNTGHIMFEVTVPRPNTSSLTIADDGDDFDGLTISIPVRDTSPGGGGTVGNIEITATYNAGLDPETGEPYAYVSYEYDYN